MFTKFAVVQKIDSAGRVIVHSASKENMNWSFEHRRRPTRDENVEIFPFVITDSVQISTRSPGAETRCYRGLDDVIHFSDDYGVPAGFVICILGPQGYVPSLVKFREKTAIPIYQPGYASGSPGFVQVHSNRTTMQTAVILMTTANCLFGASVEFSPCQTEFPSDIRINAADTFEASILLHDATATFLTQADIQRYCEKIPPDRQEPLLSALNELVEVMKDQAADPRRKTEAREKVSALVTNLVGLGSGVVTVADSITNHGFAYGFLRMIFGYFGTTI